MTAALTTSPDPAAAWDNAAPAGRDLEVNEFMTFLLMRVGGISKGLVRAYLEPAGLSAPEWSIIATVAVRSPIPFADIAPIAHMDKAHVSRTLRSVKAKGYVETRLISIHHAMESYGNTSRVIATITQSGLEIYRQTMIVARRYQGELLDVMSQDERVLLLDVFRRLDSHMARDNGMRRQENPRGERDYLLSAQASTGVDPEAGDHFFTPIAKKA